MSTTPFPSPRTTLFNPSAWDFTTYFKYLNSVLTFPTTQQATMNFVNTVFLTTRTLLTQWATTAYATSEIVAWVTANVTPTLGTAKVWAILQYYFGGILVNTINPLTTGGTLLIGHGSVTNNVEVAAQNGRTVVLHLGDGNTSSGNIHINNGTNTTGNVNILNGTGSTGTITLGSSTSTTSLGCPLTPNYNYSPMPFAQGANTSITYGTVGRIGTTTIARGGNFYVPDGRLSNANWYIMFGLVSITLPVGVWFLNGEVTNAGGTNTTSLGIAFNDTNRDSANVAPASFTNVGAFAKKYFFLASTSSYNTTVSATYTVTTGTKTIWLQVGSGGYGFYNGPCYFTAIRIA